jgi:hypothetical protein
MSILDGFGHGVGSVNIGIKHELDFGCRGILVLSIQKLKEVLYYLHTSSLGRHFTCALRSGMTVAAAQSRDNRD